MTSYQHVHTYQACGVKNKAGVVKKIGGKEYQAESWRVPIGARKENSLHSKIKEPLFKLKYRLWRQQKPVSHSQNPMNVRKCEKMQWSVIVYMTQ